jgi:hypothetical protein
MTSTIDFGAGIQAAVLAAIEEDEVVGIGGELNVVTVEALPATSGLVVVRGAEQPYIGARALAAAPDRSGNLEVYQVRLVILCGDCLRSPGTIDDASARVVRMAQRVGALLRDWEGSIKSDGCVMSVSVSGNSTADVVIDEDETTAHAVIRATVAVSVFEAA